MVALSQIYWLTEARLFLGKAGPVWETLHDLERRFDESYIPYVIIGGLALNAHGYRRQTIDVDMVLREADLGLFLDAIRGRCLSRRRGAQAAFLRSGD